MALPAEPQFWTRLGLNPDKSTAALNGFPRKVGKILGQRRGTREAYRECLAKAIVNMWKADAMPHDEPGRVERAMQAICASSLNDLPLPRIDMRTAVTRAKDLLTDGGPPRRAEPQPAQEGAQAPRRRSHQRSPEVAAAAAAARPGLTPPVSPSPQDRSRAPPTVAATPPRLGSAPPGDDKSSAPDTPPLPAPGEQSTLVSHLTAASPRTKTRLIETALAAAQPGSSASKEFTTKAPPPARLTVEGGSNPDISNIVGGFYTAFSQNHGRPTYKKEHQAQDFDVLLYFWDDRDGKQYCGWWLGQQIGGDHVWAFCPGHAAAPPETGWQVPCDGPFDHAFVVCGPQLGPSTTDPYVSQPADPVAAARQAPIERHRVQMEHLQGRAPGGRSSGSRRGAVLPDLDPASANHVMEFSFVSQEEEGDPQLWGFYHTLAAAGLFVAEVHQDTRWEGRVNAWGGAGARYAPAVKTAGGATLNWFQSKGGRTECVDQLRPQLRRAFPLFAPDRATGRPVNRATVQQGRVSEEDARRRERQVRIAGKVLAVSGQAMFRFAAAERQGATPGVWDLLDDHVGARNVPPYHSLPWPVVLRTGVTISIPEVLRIHFLDPEEKWIQDEKQRRLAMSKGGRGGQARPASELTSDQTTKLARVMLKSVLDPESVCADADGTSADDVVEHVKLVSGIRAVLAPRDTCSQSQLTSVLVARARMKEAKWQLDDTAESWADQAKIKARDREPYAWLEDHFPEVVQEAKEKAAGENYDYEWDNNKKVAYRQKGTAKRRSPPEYGVPMKGQQPDDELAFTWPDEAVWKVPGYTVREHQANVSDKKGGSSGDLHHVDTDQGPVAVTKCSRPPAKAGADRQEFVAVWIKKEGDKRPAMVGQVTVKPHFEKLEEFMIKLAKNYAGDFSQEKFELAKQEYLKSYGGYGGPKEAAKKRPGAAEPAKPVEDEASQSEETVAAATAARKDTKKDDPEQKRPPKKDKTTKMGENPEKKDSKKRMRSPEKRSPRSAKRSAAQHAVSDSDLSVGSGFGG
ncbi:unnamed protein product [Prorocentrum cordatum]|uniref:Uncharacterized protein n=1 Tax=Prorocentrum cordatum TaxID=2364126 RepID=A0ABN9VW33_9DINO|nr:unnamed protein product [Polarella glacialis]